MQALFRSHEYLTNKRFEIEPGCGERLLPFIHKIISHLIGEKSDADDVIIRARSLVQKIISEPHLTPNLPELDHKFKALSELLHNSKDDIAGRCKSSSNTKKIAEKLDKELVGSRRNRSLLVGTVALVLKEVFMIVPKKFCKLSTALDDVQGQIIRIKLDRVNFVMGMEDVAKFIKFIDQYRPYDYNPNSG